MKEKVFDSFKQNKKLLIIMGVTFALILAIFGATYAWFTFNANDTGSITITSGTLEIQYDQGNIMEASNLKPATITQVVSGYNAGNCKYNDESHPEQICYANTFTIRNTGSLATSITATLVNITNGYTDNLKYVVFESMPSTITGNILGTNSVLVGMPNNVILASGATKTYTILIWLDENAINTDQNKNYTATIVINGSQVNDDGSSAPVLYNPSGYIYDNSNNPVPNATITLNTTPAKTATTSNNGYYRVEGLATGEYPITIKNSSNVEILNDTFTLSSGDYSYDDVSKTVTANSPEVTLSITINNNKQIRNIFIGDTYEWNYSYGGSDGSDDFQKILPSYDTNGDIDGYVVIGKVYSTDVFPVSNDGPISVFLKYDLEGTKIWETYLAMTSSNEYYGLSYSYNASGNIDGYLISGYATGQPLNSTGYSSGGYSSGFVFKYDLNGNQRKTTLIGNSSDKLFSSTASYDTNGNVDGFVTVGISSSTNLGFTSKGAEDAILVKYDLNGTKQWIVNWGGSAKDDFGKVVNSYDSNGNPDGYIVTALSKSTNVGLTLTNGVVGAIIKYDLNGGILWTRSFTTSSSFYTAVAMDVMVSYNSNNQPDGYVVRTNNHDIYKYDLDGTLVDTFDTVNDTYKRGLISYDNNGNPDGYLFRGTRYVNTSTSSNLYHIIVKYNFDGTYAWTKMYDKVYLYGFSYSYNNEGERDGYMLVGKIYRNYLDPEQDNLGTALIMKVKSD